MRSVRTMLVMVFAATACSVGSVAAPVAPPPAEVIGSPSGDAGAETGTSSSALLNGCAQSDFDTNDLRSPDGDAGAGARTITFSTHQEDGYKYTPPCMKIKAGEAVTWFSADGKGHAFLTHPLEALGGDANNPIMTPADGDSATFTFPAVGLFGFHCTEHPLMIGAILVVAN